jgi:hypothetical protein
MAAGLHYQQQWPCAAFLHRQWPWSPVMSFANIAFAVAFIVMGIGAYLIASTFLSRRSRDPEGR